MAVMSPSRVSEASFLFNIEGKDIQKQFTECVEKINLIHQYRDASNYEYAKRLWDMACRLLRMNSSDERKYEKFKELLGYCPDWGKTFLTGEAFRQFLESFPSLTCKLKSNVWDAASDIIGNELRFEELKERIKALHSKKDSLKNDSSLQDELTILSKDYHDLQNKVVGQGVEFKLLSIYFNVLIGASCNGERVNKLIKNLFTAIKDLEQLNSIVKSNEEEIDGKDAVWNFLLMECQLPVSELLQWLEVTKDSDIDPKMDEIKLGKVQDLLDFGIIARDDFSDVNGMKEKIKAAIKSRLHPATPPTADLCTKLYSALSSGLYMSYPVMSKVNYAASYAFYRLAMAFSILAPILAFPKHAPYGFATGLLYYTIKPILEKIMPINTFITFVSRVFSFMPVLFSRRRLLSYDDQARGAMELFLKSSLLGKLHIFNLEMMLTYSAFAFEGTLPGFFLAGEALENASLGGRYIARALGMIS